MMSGLLFSKSISIAKSSIIEKFGGGNNIGVDVANAESFSQFKTAKFKNII